MNTNTNELLNTAGLSNDEMLKLIEANFKPVPLELQQEAERFLGDRKSVVVPKNDKSPLAKWAKKERKKDKLRPKEEHQILRVSKAFQTT